ncbi:AI-2E family transporter [Candidatus Woesearchaeota archaeon]|nr:AI-2E family transporter [Candidatus Woesearchaeota archaeon]
MPKARTGFIAAFLFVIAVSIIIVKGLIATILGAAILSYASYPAYRRLRNRTGRNGLSALTVTIMMMLIILVPAILIINALTQEAVHLVATVGQENCEQSATCMLLNKLSGLDPNLPSNLQSVLRSIIDTFSKYLAQQASTLFISITSTIINISILFFIVYYMLKDGDKLAAKLVQLAPLSSAHKKELVDKIGNITYAVIFGHLAVAAIQGIAAFIGFAVLGVKNPVLWSVITVFAALIPGIGPASIWIPASIILGTEGYLSGSNLQMFKAAALFAYGMLVISTMDNLLKPKIIGERANIHPAFVIIGVIGGLTVFGLAGIVIGPLVLAILIVFFELAEKEGII